MTPEPVEQPVCGVAGQPETPLTQQSPPLLALADACEAELLAIARWWADNTLDHQGFIGELSATGEMVAAPKGIILNARILWFFSEYCLTHGAARRALADRAYHYLVRHFVDREQGGVYWSVDAAGQPLDTKKQTYAQAFAIYGLSAYYRLSKNAESLALAHALFALVERHCLDDHAGGYVEALDRHWQPLADVRLSEKDENAPKTMNNHLHVLEAYTGLHLACRRPEYAAAVRKNILWMCDNITDAHTGHLRLFMDMQWHDLSPSYSYGHDIEASWLIYEALEVLGDAALLQRYTPLVLQLAETCVREGIGEQGQVLDKFDKATGYRHNESEWWVQAEAMVGFVNAWQLSGEPRYLRAAQSVWDYIQRYQLDRHGGEWHWYSTLDQQKGFQRYKMGFWKGPYHNGRAMLEVARRLRMAGRDR